MVLRHQCACTLEDDCRHKAWTIHLDPQQGSTTKKQYNATRDEVRDAVTAEIGKAGLDSVEEKRRTAKEIRRKQQEIDKRSGGMVMSCLSKDFCVRNRTGGWTAIVDLEGFVLDVKELDMHGEGARHNLNQTIVVMLDAQELGVEWPLREPQDSGCFQLQTRFVTTIDALRKFHEHDCKRLPLWTLFASLGTDVYIDPFHFPNHSKRDFCQRIMNPADRVAYLHDKYPGYNSQVCEQLWSISVKYCKSITYMSMSHHRAFVCSSES